MCTSGCTITSKPAINSFEKKNSSLCRLFQGSAPFQNKFLLNVDFSLWGKQWGFPKLNFLGGFKPIVYFRRKDTTTALLQKTCKSISNVIYLINDEIYLFFQSFDVKNSYADTIPRMNQFFLPKASRKHFWERDAVSRKQKN